MRRQFQARRKLSSGEISKTASQSSWKRHGRLKARKGWDFSARSEAAQGKKALIPQIEEAQKPYSELMQAEVNTAEDEGIDKDGTSITVGRKRANKDTSFRLGKAEVEASAETARRDKKEAGANLFGGREKAQKKK